MSIKNKVPEHEVKKLYRLWNKNTGEVVLLDPVKARRARMCRRVHAWSEVVLPAFGTEIDLIMVTLTYRPEDEWKPNDIRDFIKKLRRAYGAAIRGYAWVAEMQKRGAVHYHVILAVKKNFRIDYPDKNGLWDHGMSKVELARTPYYLVSYTGKEYQKTGLPKGIRSFSVWLSKEWFTDLQRAVFRASTLPFWLYEIVIPLVKNDGILPIRLKEGGWLFKGTHYSSPWKFMCIEFKEIKK